MSVFVFLLLGFVFLFFGGDFLVRGSVSIALKLKISTLVVGMTVVAGSITAQTLIQNAVDPEVRARVISITAVLSWGLPAIGAFLMGWIAEFIGLSITLASGAILGVLVWFWGHKMGARLQLTLEKGNISS